MSSLARFQLDFPMALILFCHIPLQPNKILSSWSQARKFFFSLKGLLLLLARSMSYSLSYKLRLLFSFFDTTHIESPISKTNIWNFININISQKFLMGLLVNCQEPRGTLCVSSLIHKTFDVIKFVKRKRSEPFFRTLLSKRKILLAFVKPNLSQELN